MQSLSVALVIWLLKCDLILRIDEKALSQSAVLIGKVKYMRLNKWTNLRAYMHDLSLLL